MVMRTLAPAMRAQSNCMEWKLAYACTKCAFKIYIKQYNEHHAHPATAMTLANERRRKKKPRHKKSGCCFLFRVHFGSIPSFCRCCLVDNRYLFGDVHIAFSWCLGDSVHAIPPEPSETLNIFSALIHKFNDLCMQKDKLEKEWGRGN